MTKLYAVRYTAGAAVFYVRGKDHADAVRVWLGRYGNPKEMCEPDIVECLGDLIEDLSDAKAEAPNARTV